MSHYYTQSPLTKQSNQGTKKSPLRDDSLLSKIQMTTPNILRYSSSKKNSNSSPLHTFSSFGQLLHDSIGKYISTPVLLTPEQNEELNEFVTPCDGFVTPCDENPFEASDVNTIPLGYSPVKPRILEDIMCQEKSKNYFTILKYVTLFVAISIPILALCASLSSVAIFVTRIPLGRMHLENNHIISSESLAFGKLFSTISLKSAQPLTFLNMKPNYHSIPKIIEYNSEIESSSTIWLNPGSLVHPVIGDTFRIAIQGEFIALKDTVRVESMQYDWKDSIAQECYEGCEVSTSQLWIGNNAAPTDLSITAKIPIGVRITIFVLSCSFILGYLIVSISLCLFLITRNRSQKPCHA